MGSRSSSNVAATPSTQRKRRAEEDVQEDGEAGGSRAVKKASVEVRQELPGGMCAEANEAKPSSKWILKIDALAQITTSALLRRAEGLFLDGDGDDDDDDEMGRVWRLTPLESAARRMFEYAKEGGEMTDMDFVLDNGRRVGGHKVWLMARCEYIRVMLSSGMREAKTGVVPVRECSEGAFMALLEYVYTERLGVTSLGQDWAELWRVAHLFGMEGMGEGLMDAVTMGNVEEAARVAVERGIVRLMEKCESVCRYEHDGHSSFDKARSVIRTMDLLVQNGKGTAEGIYAILEAMKMLKDDALMLENACATLGALTGRASTSRSEFEEMGGIGVIVDALQNHRTNDGIQEHGWKALENWGSETVLVAMNTYGSNEWLQVHGCKALQRLACQNELHGATGLVSHRSLTGENQSSLQHGESDGEALSDADIMEMIRTVFEVIMPIGKNKNRPDTKVEHGLEALSNFGVKAVVIAMNAYPGDAWVQEHCCKILVELMPNPANGFLAWKEGGLESVLSAMKAHRDSPEVNFHGCGAIVFFAAVESVITDAKKDEMFCAVMKALEAHKGSSRIQVTLAALKALLRFCSDGNAETKLHIAGAALEAMRALASANVQLLACRILKQLCGEAVDDKFRRFVVEADGVEAVVKVLKDHKTVAEIQRQGCEVLAKLCADADARHRAGSCGGVEAAVNVVEGTIEYAHFDEETGEAGGRALTRLCVGYAKREGNRRLAWAAADAICGGNVCEGFHTFVDGHSSSDSEDGYESEYGYYRYYHPSSSSSSSY